ncbi:MAG TPA: peptide deformylase [Acidimicrobiales bacterium]|nr:peptide deformylase [Acidimicrobiales bacterium]
MPTFDIRVYGDPVLRQKVAPVTAFDGGLARLAEDMIATMHAAPGVGLAANQVGVQKSLFVFDIGDGPQVVANPRISESRGEWTFEEGCLSVPGLYWPIVRPKEVLLSGQDLDGEDIEIEGDELLGRVFQHEVDHLEGVLLIERLDPDQRREAKRILRARALGLPEEDAPGRAAAR